MTNARKVFKKWKIGVTLFVDPLHPLFYSNYTMITFKEKGGGAKIKI